MMINPISFGSNMDIYNEHFKKMKRDDVVNFENFNGHRTIKLYCGDKYMNKITRKLNKKTPYQFIRFMVNKGTKQNPDLRDATYTFTGPGGDLLVYINEVHGMKLKGVTLQVFRDGFDSVRKQYDSLAQLRKSRFFRGYLNDIKKQSKAVRRRIATSL